MTRCIARSISGVEMSSRGRPKISSGKRGTSRRSLRATGIWRSGGEAAVCHSLGRVGLLLDDAGAAFFDVLCVGCRVGALARTLRRCRH